jgi:hypothetical protein
MYSRRTVYPDQLIGAIGKSVDDRVDSPCLPDEVRVEGAEDDTGVFLRPVHVQAEKMPAVMGQKDSLPGCSKRQNLGVGHGSISVACLKRGQDIVTQPSQFRNYLHRDVLVGIEEGH